MLGIRCCGRFGAHFRVGQTGSPKRKQGDYTPLVFNVADDPGETTDLSTTPAGAAKVQWLRPEICTIAVFDWGYESAFHCTSTTTSLLDRFARISQLYAHPRTHRVVCVLLGGRPWGAWC